MQEQPEKLMKQPKKFRILGPVASVFVSSQTGSWRLEKPNIEYEKCIKCGTCEKYCPTNVITINRNRFECIEIMWDYCKGCGICANVCPAKCITMIEERGENYG